jgi:uncharacterized protein with FMN-binding domain
MLSKRFFLIAGGTVGGLGAVLAITPPQFGSTSGLALGTGSSLSGGTTSLAGGSTSTTTTTTTTTTPATTAATPTPATTKKSTTTTTKKTTTKKTTTKKSSTSTSSSSTSNGSSSSSGSTTTTASTPTPASTPQSSGVSGTFTGAAANTRYGPVQVQITVVNGKITNAIALTYPTESFRDQQINQQAIPYLIQETLAAQSANIQGVGGASYTSQGWADSLQSALTKAGL